MNNLIKIAVTISLEIYTGMIMAKSMNEIYLDALKGHKWMDHYI